MSVSTPARKVLRRTSEMPMHSVASGRSRHDAALLESALTDTRTCLRAELTLPGRRKR